MLVDEMHGCATNPHQFGGFSIKKIKKKGGFDSYLVLIVKKIL